MDTLWAPWRSSYILGGKPTPSGATGCIFCDKPRADDDKHNLIVARGRNCFVLLNLYPYNNGHLMIVPYRHAASLVELSRAEAEALMATAQTIEPVLRAKMNCEGFNIGMNVGSVAGAGIAGHLHLHIVPRWSGDANFMPVLSETRVISQSLEAVRDLLSAPLQNALDATSERI